MRKCFGLLMIFILVVMSLGGCGSGTGDNRPDEKSGNNKRNNWVEAEAITGPIKDYARRDIEKYIIDERYATGVQLRDSYCSYTYRCDKDHESVVKLFAEKFPEFEVERIQTGLTGIRSKNNTDRVRITLSSEKGHNDEPYTSVEVDYTYSDKDKEDLLSGYLASGKEVPFLPDSISNDLYAMPGLFILSVDCKPGYGEGSYRKSAALHYKEVHNTAISDLLTNKYAWEPFGEYDFDKTIDGLSYRASVHKVGNDTVVICKLKQE